MFDSVQFVVDFGNHLWGLLADETGEDRAKWE
jgi:hypothetical protein